MGYYADAVDCDLIVPPERVAEALAAFNESEEIGGTYESLSAAVEDNTGFEGCEESDEMGFVLGWHTEKYGSYTEQVLGLLARFAPDGSVVRFRGEEGDMFGFQAMGGRLHSESGTTTWELDPPTLYDFVAAYEAYDGDNVAWLIHMWSMILNGRPGWYCRANRSGMHDFDSSSDGNDSDRVCAHCGVEQAAALNP